MRYQKVDKAVSGFEAPNWIQHEIEENKFIDSLNQLASFHKLYQTTMKQNVGFKMIFSLRQWLQILTLKIFFKESDISKLEIASQTLFPQYDLSTPSQKKEFEDAVEKLNEDYPGLLTRWIQDKFDFEEYYMKQLQNSQSNEVKEDNSIIEEKINKNQLTDDTSKNVDILNQIDINQTDELQQITQGGLFNQNSL